MHTSHPLYPLLHHRRIILGSGSPRRHALLSEMGLDFEVRTSGADESHPSDIDPYSLPVLLASRKSDALLPIAKEEVLITADTVVIHGDQLLEKPETIDQARLFLSQLSGQPHTVVTGYTITVDQRRVERHATTEVTFGSLTYAEIEYYVSCYDVMDKAGAYGIQDWIGLIGVHEVHGSFNNVIGLPTAMIYQDLKKILEDVGV